MLSVISTQRGENVSFKYELVQRKLDFIKLISYSSTRKMMYPVNQFVKCTSVKSCCLRIKMIILRTLLYSGN